MSQSVHLILDGACGDQRRGRRTERTGSHGVSGVSPFGQCAIRGEWSSAEVQTEMMKVIPAPVIIHL